MHSSLEAVGLTAAVSAALTEAKISCNVLAGFHHDHLLVPVADAERALEVLHELSAGSRTANGGGQQPAPTLVLRTEEPADRLPSWRSPRRPSPFARHGAAGRRGAGGVELLRRLFDCAEYLPEFSIVAELDGEIVGHVISTRGRAGELELLGLGPIGVTPGCNATGSGRR